MWAPEFRREIEEPVAGAIEVRGDDRLVVVEGNYLLLQDDPWCDVADLLDVVWYLRPDDDARRGEESRHTSTAHVLDVAPG